VVLALPPAAPEEVRLLLPVSFLDTEVDLVRRPKVLLAADGRGRTRAFSNGVVGIDPRRGARRRFVLLAAVLLLGLVVLFWDEEEGDTELSVLLLGKRPRYPRTANSSSRPCREARSRLVRLRSALTLANSCWASIGMP